MWTRFLGATVGLSCCSFGCAASAPAARPPEYFRSPRLDYVEPARLASDGAELGAHQHAADDWLLASLTHERSAPGWVTRYAGWFFEYDRARSGHGAFVEAPSCDPPLRGPASPADADARAALQRAWLEMSRASPLPHLASTLAEELRKESSHWLVCAQR